MERQFAAGGIVIRKDKEGLMVLLIKDGYGHWIWPKGHIEEGEGAEGAALREIVEETGLGDVRILEELGKQRYYFVHKGKRIFKTVHIFLMVSGRRRRLKVQRSEIRAARWYPPAKALSTIEYDGSRALLEKAIRTFRRKYC